MKPKPVNPDVIKEQNGIKYQLMRQAKSKPNCIECDFKAKVCPNRPDISDETFRDCLIELALIWKVKI